MKKICLPALLTLGLAAAAPAQIEPFLGEPEMDLQQVFQGGRFPNLAVAKDGSVLATWGKGGVRLRRSEDGGKTWGEEIVIAKPGFQSGGITVDDNTGDIIAFVEDRHPPAP
ncbi:MAG: sialidase family protein, partial [Verrucomicrobiota bacterium]